MAWLDDLPDAISHDLDAFETYFQGMLRSARIDLVRDVGTYLQSSGGRRFRPILVSLFGHLFKLNSEKIVPLAASMELLHTAMLLHDDVIDDATHRRHQLAANRKWNNSTSVLVGDVAYLLSFNEIARFDDMSAVRYFVDYVHEIARGEINQLIHIGNATITETIYFDIITKKTAYLFALSVGLVVFLTQGNQSAIGRAVTDFGLQFGIAFQLLDDLEDFFQHKGKLRGKDVMEGKYTLPVIYAMNHASSDQKQEIKGLMGNQLSDQQLDRVVTLIGQLGGFQYTKQKIGEALALARQAMADLRQAFPIDSVFEQYILDGCDYIAFRANQTKA